jgi:hypothetical protein
MRALRQHITYANVTATLALFVALGGTSYAALTLPRNSVGDRQIRAGAVRSSEVRDRSLGVRDLSLAARSSLRGATGPTGPAGPAGASAVRYFAAVSAAGQATRGNATSGGSAGATGSYVVGFAQPVNGCAFSATLADATGGIGRIAATDSGDGRVAITTVRADGSPADLPFHLVVAC